MDQKLKKELRERILTLLRNQEEEERLKKSLLIKDKLFRMPAIRKAKTILFYASFNGEVDTTQMIKQARESGKRVLLPRIEPEDKQIIPTLWDASNPLTEGRYGIKEPQDKKNSRIDLEAIDAVIVPGVAFDKKNHRLGRGGGYYDRFLARLPNNIPTFGVAFDFQRVDRIPQLLDHDIALTHVVTN